MMDYALWAVLIVGHLAIWCVVFNRIHATAFPRHIRKLTEKLIIVAVLLGFLWFALLAIFHETISITEIVRRVFISRLYLAASFIAGVYFILRWVARKFTLRPPVAIVSQSSQVIDVRQLNEDPVYVGPIAKALEWVPGNQSHQIEIERKTFALQRLPKTLDGLKICHLSDFHLTGHIDIGYYQKIVQEVNQFEADLVLITGDLIDEYECLNWIDDIFGKLAAKHGVMYVLGNHDKRIKDEPLLRKKLSDAGLIEVNGKWVVREVNGACIAMAGNELPWYGGAEKLQPFSNPKVMNSDGDDPAAMLKILLSHTPDQFTWAKKFDFDLMLAGHTHGGQIQLPIIGPIVAPSRYGIKYASGTFMIDNMLMHVSRGISGDECIRINCRPEVGFFTLTCPAQ